ncbi:MAG TPA: calcium-binding protein [Pseudaminobacter sp.]|nr:calcium-binding protein [Pseudaminobacter sp.]
MTYKLAAGQEIESLAAISATSTATIHLTGNELPQTLAGNAGVNALNGGGGADRMVGGAGNDTYFVDNEGDTVIEANGGGIDTVKTYVGYYIGSQFIENVTCMGTGSMGVTGNYLDNKITGNAGANLLNGRGGADTLIGLAGNDTYFIENVLDKVIEANGGGTDTVYTSVSRSFVDQFVEIIYLQGSANINATGNSLANSIGGNNSDNVINGREGNDGLGGGYGSDIFVFNTTLGPGNIDTIGDFNVNDDTVALASNIFGQARGSGVDGLGTLLTNEFRANATGQAEDADDRIIYETDSGRIFYDFNGNAAGGNYLFATTYTGLALTNSDFILV